MPRQLWTRSATLAAWLLAVLGWPPAAWPDSHTRTGSSGPIYEGASANPTGKGGPSQPPTLFREQGAREIPVVFSVLNMLS